VIALILSALRTRWVPALALALLAAGATAAAVSGPAYRTAVDRAVVEQDFATAPLSQRSIAVSSVTVRTDNGAVFDQAAGVLSTLSGFSLVLSSEVTVATAGGGTGPGTRTLSYRQDACAHLTIVSGRCPAGGADVLVGERTAAAAKLTAGSSVVLAYAEQQGKVLVVSGVPKRLTVVGVYRVPQPHDPYWGLRGYFTDNSEPLFTNQATLAGLDHGAQSDTLEAVAGADRFTPDRLPQLRRDLTDVTGRLAGIQTDTHLPDLLNRIDADLRVTGDLVPVAGLPLVPLAWFVIFLAVRYATEARRTELGVVALRGVRAPRRWWLAAGENLVPIAAGALLGYRLGPGLVGWLARTRLGVPGSDPHAVRYALVAGVGALVAVLLAQARDLTRPAAELLRRVPARVRAWQGVAGEAIILLLAGYAAVQLRLSGTRLTGLSRLAPALLLLAVAVVAARAVVPLANRYAARALRRGRTGVALAAVQVGRRPGAQRLFVLLVVAVGLLGFAGSAVDVAAQARADRAEVGTGAARTLQVGAIDVRALLSGVRAADPDGRYAMAVARVPTAVSGQPPVLAVDAPRLGAVAAWRAGYSGTPAGSVGARLHAAAPAPVVLRGGVALDLDAAGPVPDGAAVKLAVVPLVEGDGKTVELGHLSAGRHTYPAALPDCPGGCRLTGVTVTGTTGGIVLHELRGTGPDGAVVSGTAGHWRADAGTADPADGDGLTLHPDGGTVTVRPVDTPYPLPVASTAPLTELPGLDGHPVPVTRAVPVGGLPALGTTGTLVDLEYLQRLSTATGAALDPQVWLAADAPPDIVDRLGRNGVPVTGEQRAAAVRAALDAQGTALALWFHLVAAGFAVLLAAGGLILVATVDRRRRAEDLAALRAQGLARRTAGRAALLSQVLPALAATVVGLAAAALVWWVLGGGLPLFTDQWTQWPRPSWPRPVALLGCWLAAAAVLLGAATATARWRAFRGAG
jgi:hypothetical protein